MKRRFMKVSSDRSSPSRNRLLKSFDSTRIVDKSLKRAQDFRLSDDFVVPSLLRSSATPTTASKLTSYSLRAVSKMITAFNDDEDGTKGATAGKDKVKGQQSVVDNYGNSPNWTTTTKSDESFVVDGTPHNLDQISTAAQTRRKKVAQARLMLTTKSRKVRYGWYAKEGADDFKMVRDGDSDFKVTDPDERICFNEQKAWAGDFVMCLGQTNLCKWL
ncbi:hypothetical protein GPALN_001841 [Globodera pallida]|uniref:BRCT domain-containing protein n=1 Tax=Globodera pallida TaxID=36090 RepID=A0A183BWI4_GLOPA|nr:hypothetical protein GPALN_001841 [Globodera pallida]